MDQIFEHEFFHNTHMKIPHRTVHEAEQSLDINFFCAARSVTPQFFHPNLIRHILNYVLEEINPNS